jgi:glycosyltransferase involved in cell wall biosynthesis
MSDLIVGCCTAVLDRPLFARLNVLQIATQTVRPHFHSVVASGGEFDGRFIDDLLDDTTLLTCVPQPVTTLACYTLGLEELQAREVNLFFCLDHDCVYKRQYIEAVCGYVESAGLDLNEGLFCLNLIDQQWITLYDDARADLQLQSFQMGLGLSAEEAKLVVVGAPPTFVFGRAAAEVVIARVRQGGTAGNGYHDMFWRRVLRDAGVRITQVRTAEPVFAYVRHSNNLCWGARTVSARPASRANGHAPMRLAQPKSRPAAARLAHDGAIDVSVVIPTYNEGEWLQKTVESVRAAATGVRYEILVVDDGCSDGSVEAIAIDDNLRIVETGGEQLGLIVAKNTGAKAARGRYLCFMDSHMIVHDHWLDYLRETCDAYPDGALVSGNLPDITRFSAPDQLDRHQYGYSIRNCLLGTLWHFYGCPYTDQPYLEPLTPGGLMFTQKRHFARLGGFDSVLRKWGAEDIQISLQNFYLGGDNVVDPRVVIYHYYKSGPTKKRTFTVSNAQHGFNCLYVAAAYFPHEYYLKVREALAPRGAGVSFGAEIESGELQERLEKLRSEFVRGFDEWTTQFPAELRKFFQDAEQRAVSTERESVEPASMSGD